jgi:hypothetical protein
MISPFIPTPPQHVMEDAFHQMGWIDTDISFSSLHVDHAGSQSKDHRSAGLWNWGVGSHIDEGWYGFIARATATNKWIRRPRS